MSGGDQMAKRPVYHSVLHKPFFIESMVEFEYFSGFSISQKRKSIESLHKAYADESKDSVLEVSSKSPELLGVELSAFNLLGIAYGGKYSIESIFQSSKVFEKGGPYLDLLDKYQEGITKKDMRLRNSGKIVGFNLEGKDYPTTPKTLFYDWIYINALHSNSQLREQVKVYQDFTDIEFNPKKSINCQARSVAIYVGLCLSNQIENALFDIERFQEIVYVKGVFSGNDNSKPTQMKLF